VHLGNDRVVPSRLAGVVACLLMAAILGTWQAHPVAAQTGTGGCWASPPSTEQGYPTWSTAPNMVIDASKTYTAEVTTSKGVITIELDAKSAPQTVNNFICLSEGGYYDFTLFHRVITGFMIQAGDPTGTGRGGPGYQFGDELPTAANPYTRGTVAMANAGANTNGSQFFIVQQDQQAPFPSNYSIFGHVTSGMDVVDAIAKVPVKANDTGESSAPAVTVGIVSVKILEDGQPLVLKATPASSASPVAASASPAVGVTTPVATTAPVPTQPAVTTPDSDDGSSNTALWIAVGAAAVAAVGYGIWRGTRRKPAAPVRRGGSQQTGGSTQTTTRTPASRSGTTTRPAAPQRRPGGSNRPSRRKRST